MIKNKKAIELSLQTIVIVIIVVVVLFFMLFFFSDNFMGGVDPIIGTGESVLNDSSYD